MTAGIEGNLGKALDTGDGGGIAEVRRPGRYDGARRREAFSAIMRFSEHERITVGPKSVDAHSYLVRSPGRNLLQSRCHRAAIRDEC